MSVSVEGSILLADDIDDTDSSDDDEDRGTESPLLRRVDAALQVQRAAQSQVENADHSDEELEVFSGSRKPAAAAAPAPAPAGSYA
jgi:hypothetical protein